MRALAVVLVVLAVGISAGTAEAATQLSLVGSATDPTLHRIDGPTSVKVAGHYAYVAAGVSGALTIVDLSDPAHPRIAGSVADPRMNDAVGVDVSGRYAYVTSKSTNTLTVVDVSDAAHPGVAGSVRDDDKLNGAYSVQVVGGYAYIGAQGCVPVGCTAPGGNALTIVDVSDPANPSVAGSVSDPVKTHHLCSVVVVGHYAYGTAFYSNTFTTFDVSDPAHPKIVGSKTDSTKLKYAADVDVVGHYAYVVDQLSKQGRLTVLDVTNPAQPTIVGSVLDTATPTRLDNAYAVTVSGSYAYVAARNSAAMTVVNVSNPAAPAIVDSIRDASLATDLDVALQNGRVWVAAYCSLTWCGTNIQGELTGVNVTAYSGPPDPSPPNTSLDDAATDAGQASFWFSASEAGSTYECSLDGGSWQMCNSPASYTGLAPGAHTFAVVATDAAGNLDPTPATYGWTVAADSPAAGCGASSGVTTWTGAGGDGNWSNAANWNAGTPTSASNACIPAGFSQISISSPATAATLESHSPLRIAAGGLTLSGPGASITDSTLELSGGTLAGAGSLTVALGGTLAWDGDSAMDGNGTTTIQPGATLTISDAVGTGARTIQGGRRLSMNGTGSWSGADSMAFGSGGGTFDVGGTFAISSDQPFADDPSHAGAVHVRSVGTLTKTGGSGASTFAPALENDGVVTAASGTLTIAGGSGAGTDSGTWDASSGAELDLTGGTRNASTLTVDGAGAVRIAGASLNLNGPGSVAGDASLGLSSGALGGSGTLTVDSGGAFAWDGDSAMGGSGSTVVSTGGTLTVSDAHGGGSRTIQDGRTLELDGSGSWSGADSIAFAGIGGALDIGGTLTVTNDQAVTNTAAPPGLVHVTAGGTLHKSGGSGTTTVAAPLTNDGTVAVDSGTLSAAALTNYDASQQSLNGGHYSVSGGADLELPGAHVATNAADITLTGAASEIGNGSGSALDVLATNAAGARLALRSGSNLSVPGSLSNAGTVSLGSSDELDVAGGYTQQATGTYDVAVAGDAAGTYGRLAATGTATLAGALTVNSAIVPVYGAPTAHVLDSAGRTGTFATVTAPSKYDARYVAGGVDVAGGTPPIYVSDAWTMENSAAGELAFTVSLAGPTTRTVTVKYATANGTAIAGADYTAKSGTLSFSPGETQKVVHVPVTADAVRDAAETMKLNLSSPVNAVIADTSATGTIVDPQAPLFVAVADATLPEGNAGTTTADFTVSLSQPPAAGETVKVTYSTADGSAKTSNADYAYTSGTLTFNSTTGATQVVHVPVNGDTTVEPNETFALNLKTVTGAQVADNAATGTIVNDDGTPGVAPKVPIYVSNAWIPEGDSGTSAETFTVSLGAPSAQTVTVQYATANGTALAGSDYTATSGTLTFNPGETQKAVPVTVNGDTASEGNESYSLKLSSPVNAVLADSAGTGTIADEEGPIFAYAGDAGVVEGNSGSRALTYTVSLSQAPSPGQTVTVNYATANGTALAGNDYTATSGSLVFTSATGATQTVSVPVAGEAAVEPNETLSLKLTSVVGAAAADAAGTGTIVNDD